jgi:hypothetical protein
MKLGKLETIDLRTAWKNEALDFTTWLAEKENLDLLGEELGLGIKLIRTEADVGDFNVDILAEDEASGKKVIIENQLEATDHNHLGKIITYAAGYNAEFIIWVVREVREEHKQAIDWLNERTDDNVNFFIVKVELWRIGESPYAPKFQVISKPNDWAKALRTATNKGDLTETKLLQLEFWTKFKEYAASKSTKLKLRKVSAQHWYDISLGSSVCHITVSVNTREESLACWIWISNSKETFHKLFSNKNKIEGDLGFSLEWSELPEKKASWIKVALSRANLEEKNRWPEFFDWMLKTAEKFREIFTKYL